MPFSVTRMVKYLYKPMTYNVTPLKQFISDYVGVISTKYPFWNRTQGSEHFMLACHDWGHLQCQFFRGFVATRLVSLDRIKWTKVRELSNGGCFVGGGSALRFHLGR